MKQMMVMLALALALIGAGFMQVDGVSDVWDYVFGGIVLLMLALMVGSGRDFL